MSPVAISIISPDVGTGRNVVAFGLANTLATERSVSIFRPIAHCDDALTTLLLSATNSQLTCQECITTCPCKAGNNPTRTRSDSLSTYTKICARAQPEIVLEIGSDNSEIVDPARLFLDADIAADLRARVFLTISTINRDAKQVFTSIENCRKLIEGAGTVLGGIFVTDCKAEQKNSLQNILNHYQKPVWMIDEIAFDDNPSAVGIHSEALKTFQECVSMKSLHEAIEQPQVKVTTPCAFQNDLLERAKSKKQTIVLPEGHESRILQAADYLLEHEIVNLIIIGNQAEIEEHGRRLGLQHLGKAFYQPINDEQVLSPMIKELCTIRASKGITPEQARHQLADANYFATMLVVEGKADGLVSGAVNSTAKTVRPALQVIKTKTGTSLVSGAFLMLFKDHATLFADCAINLNPTAEQLADIAIQSAQTAKAFGIDPTVGMLSYSTLGSGKGPDVELVERATAIIQNNYPALPIVGPIQFDAAWSPDVAATKAAGNSAAGHVNVFVFPSLSAGNIGYKAVQRSSGAVAIGPILQGLNRPVNDLSRGASVTDIINTIAVTAVEAQDSE